MSNLGPGLAAACRVLEREINRLRAITGVQWTKGEIKKLQRYQAAIRAEGLPRVVDPFKKGQRQRTTEQAKKLSGYQLQRKHEGEIHGA